MIKTMLKQLNLDHRVWFEFISASEAQFFAETVNRMVKKLKEIGPNQLSSCWEI